ncbi:MAG: DUF2029 domain-containing protein [Elusimicrobia bacterium]|jgi:hypothetical protein|nr:DUF2029 domain-containing protein [Elusimicrobiota bacterium]MBK7574492.1 DUF2029 domain-containing protein [Elusimicrobiota bacterium]MBK8126636.1 DUF2029 domain-containing protein [Elusimicrobiota bacterium]MBK9057522.1 DUF2029 domain-containing protein [Elusimicrobiota bacterium]MBK9922767.1 DUF2029 domain-containing protein [Elusimicrobiota bacterium]
MRRILTERRGIFGCAAAVLLAAGLRAVAFGWGLPLKYAHIDESVVSFYAMRIASGVFNPGFYDYPGLFLNLLAGFFRAGLALTGVSFADATLRYAAGDSAALTLTARGLSFLFALGTVALVFRMGRRWAGAVAGTLVATLLAVNPLHVRHSHYGTVDALAVLLTFWTMARLAAFAMDRSRPGAFQAGALVGLAAAVKYFPGIFILPLIGIPLVKKDRDAAAFVGWGLAGAALGFALGSPSTWLGLPDFMARFGHLAPKIVGTPGHAVPLVPTLAGLWANAGPAAVGMAAVGFAVFWISGGERRWFAGLWAGLLVFLGFWSVQSDHYALPLYPGLFLMAVDGARWLSRGRKKICWVLWGVLLITPLPRTARVLRDLSAPDTRLRAVSWARANLPAGATVLRFAHTPEFGPRDPYRVRVDFTNVLLEDVLATGDMSRLKGFDYVIHSEYTDQEGPAVDRLSRAFSLVHREAGPAPRFPHHPVVRVYRTRVP